MVIRCMDLEFNQRRDGASCVTPISNADSVDRRAGNASLKCAAKAKGQEAPSLLGDALRPLSDYESDAQTPSPDESIADAIQAIEIAERPAGDLLATKRGEAPPV
jgi:hypothetical protein